MRPTTATSSILLTSLLMALSLLSSTVGAGPGHEHGDEEPATWPGDPYLEESHFHGQIGCAFAQRPIATKDNCDGSEVTQGIHMPVRDANAQTSFESDVDAGMSAIAIRLDAPEPLVYQPAFQMTWQVPVDLIEPIAGPTPIVSIQEFQPDQEQTQIEYSHEAGTKPAKFEVRVDPNAQLPQIAIGQQFTIYITVFYNGEPVPEGYVPGPA